MITRRTMPWSIYAVLLAAIEILGFYASACFLYDDVSIQNFSEYMIRGCTENWFLPWRIANRMTPECMGIALMGWIFLEGGASPKANFKCADRYAADCCRRPKGGGATLKAT